MKQRVYVKGEYGEVRMEKKAKAQKKILIGMTVILYKVRIRQCRQWISCSYIISSATLYVFTLTTAIAGRKLASELNQ